MGIFEKLFKSSSEKLKAKEDAERAKYLIANKEWDQLAEIGKPAVKPLISFFKDNNDVDTLVNAARTLGRIGDVRAIETLGSCVINLEAALRNRFDWDLYNAVMPAAAEALKIIGKSDVEQIIKFLKKENGILMSGIPFMWALGEICDRKAAEAVVNWLFSVGPAPPRVPGSLGTPLMYQEKFLSPPDLIRICVPPTVIPKLLGDYTDLILDLFAWQLTSYSADTEHMQFDISRCNEALQQHCKIKTPISNNILHKVSKIDKIVVGFQYGNVQSVTDYIDLRENMLMAREELKHRGWPRYDPSVYSNSSLKVENLSSGQRQLKFSFKDS